MDVIPYRIVFKDLNLQLKRQNIGNIHEKQTRKHEMINNRDDKEKILKSIQKKTHSLQFFDAKLKLKDDICSKNIRIELPQFEMESSENENMNEKQEKISERK